MATNKRPPGNPQLLLRLPKKLGNRLATDAKHSKTTAQTMILRILAAHYLIDVPDPRRGRPIAKPEPPTESR